MVIQRRFRLEAVRGEDVWDATDLEGQRACTVRLLKPQETPDLRLHDALLKPWMVGEWQGRAFTVTDRVHETARADLPWLEVARILAHLHRDGAVHGWIGPPRIVRTDAGWQLAGAEVPGERTLQRMFELNERDFLAPEVFAGRIGPPADVWALGMTMRRLGVPLENVIAGCLERRGRLTMAQVRALLEGQPLRPEDPEPRPKRPRCFRRPPLQAMGDAPPLDERLWLPGRREVLALEDESIVCRYASGTVRETIRPGGVTALDLRDGLLAAGTVDGRVLVTPWRAREWREGASHAGSISALIAGPAVISASLDGTIRVSDKTLRIGIPVRRMARQGNWLAVATRRHVLLWDLDAMRSVACVKVSTTSLRFDRGRLIAGGRVWRLP